MIRLAQETVRKQLLAFPQDDPFAVRIQSLMQAYGDTMEVVEFWVQETGGIPSAILCRMDGTISISCTAQAEIEELREFLRTVGFCTVEAEFSVVERLGFPIQLKGNILKVANAPEWRQTCDVDREPALKQAFALLKTAGMVPKSDDTQYVDFSFRCRRGCGDAVLVEGVSCALALSITEESVFLGGVATLPEYRGNGYAAQAVGALVEKYKDKQIYLLIKEETLLRFYARNGFVKIADWAVGERNETGLFSN